MEALDRTQEVADVPGHWGTLCRSVPFNFLNSFEGCQVEQTAAEDSQLALPLLPRGKGPRAWGQEQLGRSWVLPLFSSGTLGESHHSCASAFLL